MNKLIDKDQDSLELPWVEKYRPKTLKNIISQSITIQTLQKFIEKGSLPHLIFTGPAGIGKTSTAYSLINDLLGTDKISKDMILERNASDNVRMNTRDEIKNFVNHAGMLHKGFKFVVLDEADLIPRAMQGAFRRIIEMAPANVKFILMCNYIEKIIDPLLSRCAIFRFYPLPKDAFHSHIRKICEFENINITSLIIDTIYYISNGDMRRAINLLQMASALSPDNSKNSKNIKNLQKMDSPSIQSDVIYQISGFLKQSSLENIFQELKQRNINDIVKILQKNQGFSSRGLFRQIFTWITQQRFPYPINEKLIEILGEYDFRLTLEADPTIQIHGFFAEVLIILETLEEFA
ncbi:MAG: AAA family ATPase [Promethearchaeota archaeon]